MNYVLYSFVSEKGKRKAGDRQLSRDMLIYTICT